MGMRLAERRRRDGGPGAPRTYAEAAHPGYVEQHRRAVAAYYQRHKELGLCVRCNWKATRGRFCRRHAKKKHEQAERRRARRIAAGLCGHCGRLPMPGHRFACEKHVELNRIYSRRSAIRHGRIKRDIPDEARTPRKCRACGMTGHDRRTCLAKQAEES